MENTYQFGPIGISQSFVKQPLFWPGVAGVLLVAAVILFMSSGRISLPSSMPKPSITAKVFPLDQRFSSPVLYTSGTAIYRSDGHSEEKLFEVGSEVLSLVPSPDGSKLAATYKLPSGGLNSSGYPYTSLIFWDMNTQRSLPLIAENNTTVRYPQWSDDNRYISFWVNDGQESFIYDTVRRKAIYSVKSDGGSAVSPIIFLPGSTGIVYIKNSTVYSAAMDGSRPIALAEQASSTHVVGGSTVALTPSLSPNGISLAYYALNGDLTVVNTTTRETKTVGSSVITLGFLNNDELLYLPAADYEAKQPTLYRFSLTQAQSTKVSTWNNFLRSSAWTKAAVLLTSQSQFYLPSVFPNLGPQLLSKDGQVVQDCSKADFHYTYNNSSDDTRFPDSGAVISPDSKYLLGSSEGSLAVLDTSTCQPYIFSQSKTSVATWVR